MSENFQSHEQSHEFPQHEFERASSIMEYELDLELDLELHRCPRQEPCPDDDGEWDEDEDEDEWGDYEDEDSFVSELIAWCYHAKPNPRTTCNFAAATFQEPVSLLTKYRLQESNYFCEVFSSPHENLYKKDVKQGSPLKQTQNVNEMSPSQA